MSHQISSVRKKVLTSTLVLMLVLVFAPAMLAQLSTSKIEGTVRDQDTGRPLAGVQVVVEGTRLGNITNNDGYYFILNVPPGRRSITFSYTGYQKTTVSDVLLLAGQTKTVNASLNSTVVELEGIVVEEVSETLVPRDQTGTKRRLTSEDIAETPATRLEDMLVLEASVQIGGPDSKSRGLRIRGGRLGEELMVVDGVGVRNYTSDPFADGWGWIYEQEYVGSQSTDTTPLEFSTGSVEQVDIITGGFQAEYGNAQSGIVNIVTKEGGPEFRGNVKLTTDQMNPRTADYGYNQLTASIGGPISVIPNLYFHASGEIQGFADRSPTHADEGFRAIDELLVKRLNESVKNDPYFDSKYPEGPYTLEKLQTGWNFHEDKTNPYYDYDKGDAAMYSRPNPVRQFGNWMDRTLVSGKLSYTPIKGLKLLGTYNYSRNQHSYPWGRGNPFMTGVVTPSDLPNRAWELEDDTIAVVPTTYARRTHTTNILSGFDWDFYSSAERNATLQFRYTWFKSRDVNSSNLEDDYLHERTFMGWSPHNIRFEAETFPGLNFPELGTEEARIHYPDGVSGRGNIYWWEEPYRWSSWWLYYLTFQYLGESQDNYKLDLDFQLDRFNRAKTGVQMTMFDNRKFNMHAYRISREQFNLFDYKPRIFSAYVQNRTDLGDFVFDYGLRYDRFSPRNNWGFRSWDIWNEHYHIHPVDEWSPRFNVGFPVTDKAQMRFSYGVFTQLPSLQFIFNSSNYGDLEYSRTDAFEVGLSYLVSDDVVMDVVGFYRDVQGNLSNKQYFRDYWAWHQERRIRTFTTGYTNRDNGNIKGLDFTLRKRFADNYTFNFIYTLQFSRTTGSQYNSHSYFGSYLDPATGETYRPPDELTPIDGDQTHKFSAHFNYLFPQDFQSNNRWLHTVLGDVGIHSIFTMGSGQPIGPRGAESQNLREDMDWLSSGASGINYFRWRWDYNLDLRIKKNFNFGGRTRLSFFTEIFNVLNNKPAVPYPTGYSYEGAYRDPNAGEELSWSDDLDRHKKVLFRGDFNADGLLTLEEQAMGRIANWMITSTSDVQAWGRARQIRAGVNFTF